MSEELMGAILQRDKKTYGIVPRTPVGLVTLITWRHWPGLRADIIFL